MVRDRYTFSEKSMDFKGNPAKGYKQLSHVDHPGPTNMTTVRLLVVSESISTSSTVGLTGGGLRIATLGVAEGEPDGARPRDRAHTTQRRRRYTLRRLRDARQSIRERGVVL